MRDNRPTAAARGYDADWRRVRDNFLAEHPLCAVCLANGMTVAASDVDHVLAIRKGGERLNPANLQSLCAGCHSRKTAREDGGFGRQKDGNGEE